MKIVIAHLTRMEKGYFCAAGIDVKTHQHVRCVVEQGRLPIGMLSRYGGPFDMARVVDLGAAQHRPDPPHSEDHVIGPQQMRSIPHAAPGWFWDLLCSVSVRSLKAIFGLELQRVGPRSAATRERQGSVSLGCFRPGRKPKLWIKEQAAGPQVRMKMRDGLFDLSVSVTDIRLYTDDHWTPDRDAVRQVAGKIEAGEELVLSVGLTRAFAGNHWLQVNNIHLESCPTWELG